MYVQTNIDIVHAKMMGRNMILLKSTSVTENHMNSCSERVPDLKFMFKKKFVTLSSSNMI